MQVVSATYSSQLCKYQVASSLIFTALVKLDEASKQTSCNLMTNLHQADKLHNLHQACGVSVFVAGVYIEPILNGTLSVLCFSRAFMGEKA